MPIIEKTFWLLAIAATFVNAYLLRSRATVEVSHCPELKEGYDQVFKGYLIYLNLPWVVMGIGIIFGGVQTVFDYLDPQTGIVYVIAFHVTVLLLWALSVFWIYFAGGAQFLAKHPGVMNVDIKSPLVIKLLFALMLLGGMIAEIVIWSGHLPPPRIAR